MNQRYDLLLDEFEQYLKESCFVEHSNQTEKLFNEVIRYSLLGGGKRVRPMLFLMTADTLGLNVRELMPFAAAIEMIHTYSLVHDDLPAMDNDNFRRGRLTSHKKYDEGLAILAGDALLNKAYEILFELSYESDNRNILKAATLLSVSAGDRGMIGGQVADISLEGTRIGMDMMDYIIENKTGKLLMNSMICAAVIKGLDGEKMASLKRFAYNIGYSFQVVDDILDVVGSVKELGKSPGKDEKSQKNTFVSINGLDASKKRAEEMISTAKMAITSLESDYNVEFFIELADFLEKRNR